MKKYFILNCLLVFSALQSCEGQHDEKTTTETVQNKIIGGGCDGCEIMYEGMPENISSIDTSEGWNETGQKLVVVGTVYKLGEKTPAADVIIYYWQTDNTGRYSKTAKENTLHGHLRGWVKTGENGIYRIHTIRPASYPNSTIPAHIHFSIKESNIRKEYYIDDVLFEDDKFLTESERNKLQKRGGNGIGKVTMKDNVQFIRRDIILGLNIPDYPQN